MNLKGCLSVAALCAISSAHSIVPNNPIAAFPGIGRMEAVSGATVTVFGTGVAISPNYILTASHVGGDKFEQNGVVYPILQTINHPTADLSLKRIGSPIQTACPIKTNYFLNGVPSIQTGLPGDAIHIQGYGWTGNRIATGFTVDQTSQGVLRQCRNRLDLFIPQLPLDLGGGNVKVTDYIIYDLDDPLGVSPVNILGGPAIGTDEGGMGVFDSGCPWTVFENGRERIVGIGGIIGTFNGSGVLRALDWGGFGGAANVQTYASWLQATVPDLGRAILTAPNYAVGATLAGSVTNLYDIDNVSMVTETNLSASDSTDGVNFVLNGTTTASPATSMNVFLKGKCNSGLAQCDVEVKNQVTGGYVNVGTYFLTGADTQQTITVPGAGAYVGSLGQVSLRVRATPLGIDADFFQTSWDAIRVTAQ